MKRTAFLVDGYNLYHSLREAERVSAGAGLRWLDLSTFAGSFLELIGQDAVLVEVTYFSALAHHRERERPGTTARHRTYLAALADSGVLITLGHFKQKRFRCSFCGAATRVHEEKETDVSIAAHLFELYQQNTCDAAVLVTGDSDLASAVRSATTLFPAKQTFVVFPFARTSDELRSVATGCFKASASHYRRCQLPDPLVPSSGQAIAKPPGW